ncbi:MAG TPA: hypothetical protein VNI52_03470 [Sphingobacteriaceae bacterium]|nr:hypothetical protein [Sphingobacteriaceae bacterium]
MKALLSLFFILLSLFANAQTWDETFNQKETQKKYLLQQLVALKLYAGYLKKGYDIANMGINNIKGFTKGEFDLHRDFITSLKLVNPAIADKEKIIQMIVWQIAITKGFHRLSVANSVSAGDRAYFGDVKAKIIKECEFDMDELILIITSGKLEMKDDERIKRFEILYHNMEDKYQFSQSFLNQVKSLNLLKKQEERNSKASEKLHGITN